MILSEKGILQSYFVMITFIYMEGISSDIRSDILFKAMHIHDIVHQASSYIFACALE